MSSNQPDDPSEIYRDMAAEIAGDIERLLSQLNSITIDEIKRSKQLADPIDLAKCYARFRMAKERYEEAATEINKTMEVLKGKDYPGMLDDRGVGNVPCTDPDIMRTIGTATHTYVKMVNKDHCIQWLKTHTVEEDGRETTPFKSLVKEEVSVQTLAATAKELATKGQSFPDKIHDEDTGLDTSLFQTGTRDTTKWRKIASKG